MQPTAAMQKWWGMELTFSFIYFFYSFVATLSKIKLFKDNVFNWCVQFYVGSDINMI